MVGQLQKLLFVVRRGWTRIGRFKPVVRRGWMRQGKFLPQVWRGRIQVSWRFNQPCGFVPAWYSPWTWTDKLLLQRSMQRSLLSPLHGGVSGCTPGHGRWRQVGCPPRGASRNSQRGCSSSKGGETCLRFWPKIVVYESLFHFNIAKNQYRGQQLLIYHPKGPSLHPALTNKAP